MSEFEIHKESAAFEGWAVLELMGHRRLGGYVRETTAFGSALCRIDVPEVDGQPAATQFYTASAIYCLTPTTEEIARAVARGSRPAPVSRFELPSPRPEPTRQRVPDPDYGGPEEYDPDAHRYDDEDDDDIEDL